MSFRSPNAGPRLHHQRSEERDARRVREGEQEEGTHRQPRRDLQTHRTRASDIARRLSQSEEDAGNELRVHVGATAVSRSDFRSEGRRFNPHPSRWALEQDT